jgi:hypothetical protein
MSYARTRIATHLETVDHAAPAAATAAGAAISQAWNDRDFSARTTRTALEKCVLDSPAMTAPVTDVLNRLVRAFGVHVHDVPAWDPP